MLRFREGDKVWVDLTVDGIEAGYIASSQPIWNGGNTISYMIVTDTFKKGYVAYDRIWLRESSFTDWPPSEDTLRLLQPVRRVAMEAMARLMKAGTYHTFFNYFTGIEVYRRWSY